MWKGTDQERMGSWNLRDIWLEPDETDNLEPSSHSEPSLQVRAACLPASKETNLPLLENPRVDILGASLPKADLAN